MDQNKAKLTAPRSHVSCEVEFSAESDGVYAIHITGITPGTALVVNLNGHDVGRFTAERNKGDR